MQHDFSEQIMALEEVLMRDDSETNHGIIELGDFNHVFFYRGERDVRG